MTAHRLPLAVSALAVLSGWCAARHAGFAPLLWVAILVVTLWIAPSERRFVDQGWFLTGLVLLALSWVVAADHEAALQHSLLFVTAALLFGLARRAAPDDRWVGLIAAGLILTAVVAFQQALGGLERASRLVDTLPPQWREAATIRLAQARIFGTAALPGHYAVLLLMAVPLVIERGLRSSSWHRIGWAAALATGLVAIALTRSLAVFLVAGVLLLAALLRGARASRVWAGAALLLAVSAFTLAARSDLLNLEPVRLRWVNWRTTAWVLVHNPWLGVGLGGVGQAGLLAPTAGGNITPFAHNTYLQLLAEFGLAGAGLIAAGTWAVARLVRAGAAANTGLALAVAVLPLHSLVDFSAYAPEVLLPWAVLAGTLAGRVVPLPRRPLSAWLLVPVLSGGTVLAGMGWRGEAELAPAFQAPPGQAVEAALDSARWTPWAVTPVELAAGIALESGLGPGVVMQVDEVLSSRGWVRPRSASWAETRCRLLLRLGRAGEALTWAREAQRRAPARGGLAELEAACSPGG